MVLLVLKDWQASEVLSVSLASVVREVSQGCLVPR